ncbi:MAG: hypothetical protein IBX71_09155 [Candidatus Desulforudis sp.]|nr:hypothetical protein [Desulforudis sp.]
MDDIHQAFQPYYERTMLADTTDPNLLYDLKYTLEEFQIYWQHEVDAFARVFFKPRAAQKPDDQAKISAILDPVVERFKGEEKDVREEFKSLLAAYLRAYSFLSQLISFTDPELEKLYAFGRSLIAKLPFRDRADSLQGDEVALKYYRAEKTAETAIDLIGGGVIQGPVAVGGPGRDKGAKERLSRIIERLNERFGTDFTEADQLVFDQIREEMASDEMLVYQAQNNTIENFRYVFNEKFIGKVIDRMDANSSSSGASWTPPSFSQR